MKIDKLTVQRTDSEMRKLIVKSISDVSDLHSKGWVYVLQVKINGQSAVKIGSTKKGSYVRADKIGTACRGAIKIENVDDSGEVRFYGRTEDLAKMELKMARLEFTCSCEAKTQHTEHFDIDHKTALRVIRRWSTFCSLGPYNSMGQLSRIWSNRLQRKIKLQPITVEMRDIGKLLGTWDAFVYVP